MRRAGSFLLFACLLGLWGAVWAAACSGPVQNGAADVAPGSTPLPPIETARREPPLAWTAPVVVWHSLTGSEREFLAGALERIGAEHPDLSLSHAYVPPHQAADALLHAVLSGEGPNILVAPAAQLPALSAESLIASLNGVVQEDELADFLTPALFGLIQDEQLMGLPLWTDSVALFVNTDLLPLADVPEDMTQLLRRAQAAEQPLLGLYASLFHLAWGFPAFGGILLDVDNRVVLDQGTGGAAFLDWLRHADAAPGLVVSRDYEALRRAFLTGALPMFIDGAWSLAAAQEALGAAVQIREIPAGPAGPARPWLTAEAAFLVKGQAPPRLRLSAALVQELASMEADIADVAQRLPAKQAQPQAGTAPVRQFRALLPRAHRMPHGPEWPSLWRLGHELLHQTLASPESAANLVARFALLANAENGK